MSLIIPIPFIDHSRERELYLEKQNATRRYMDEFKSKRQEWKHMEKDRLEEENHRILEFATLQQAREEDRMESKRQAEEAKSLVQDKVGDRHS